MTPTKLIETPHGPMWVFDGDIGCSDILSRYGEYSRFEQAVIDAYTNSDSVVFDIGAHIGVFTIPTARRVRKVYAFEPQEEVRQVLQENIALAGVTNVEVLPWAVGFKDMEVTYTPSPTNNGSVSIYPEGGEEKVEMKSLDGLWLEKVDFIKADVEGMEIQVALGGVNTLLRDRPVLFFERDPKDDQPLIEVFGKLRYTSYLMDLPVYVPENFRGDKVNEFYGIAHKMNLGLPG